MDADIFSANLRGLLSGRKLSQKELADRIGGETESERRTYYRWLRRTVSQGLTRCEDRNREQLQRICEFFGIHPVERLWSPSMTATQNVTDECVAMLRFILQATTPVDGEGQLSHIVDSSTLMDQIRNAYGLLIEDRRLQARIKSQFRNGETLLERSAEAAAKEATPVADDATSPFADTRGDNETLQDYFVRRSLLRLRDDVRKRPNGGASVLMNRAILRLPILICKSLPDELDPAITFDQAWDSYILPALQKLRYELRGS